MRVSPLTDGIPEIMISEPARLFSALFYLILAGLLAGYPFSRYFDTIPRHRLLLAPALGWAVLGAISLPVFMLVPFRPAAVALVTLLVAAIAWLLGGWIKPSMPAETASPRLSWPWITIAGLVSLIPAYSVAPHVFHDGIGFAAPIFDHEKAALIDAMVRTGIPPLNPFFSKTGVSPWLSYYYGWYFLAAQAALLTGVNGWSADIVFTGLTAFVSLVFMGWAALRLSGRALAAWLVLPLSLTSTLFPILGFIIGPAFGHIFANEHGLESWIIQSAWVPQHLFAAVLAGLALIALLRLMESQRVDPVLCLLIGTLVGFSYNASVWVGLTGLLPVLAVTALAGFTWNRRGLWLAQMSLAGGFCLAAAAALALQEAGRLHTGPVIGFWLFPVFAASANTLLNLFGYWFLLLPLFFGALYIGALAWAAPRLARTGRMRPAERGLVAACFVPLLVAESLHSVIATNDLGWRCVLVSVLAMTIVSAAWLAELRGKAWVLVFGAALLGPGLVSGLAYATGMTATQALYGTPSPDARRFRAVDREMWRAVDALTPPREAVASNPLYEQSLTPWAGNISWAMLSNRSSCTPPSAYLAAFASGVPPQQQAELSSLAQKVFNGAPQPEDFKTLRDVYECRTLLVTPGDALWTLPRSTPEPYYRLAAEKPGDWRIYRATSSDQ